MSILNNLKFYQSLRHHVLRTVKIAPGQFKLSSSLYLVKFKSFFHSFIDFHHFKHFSTQSLIDHHLTSHSKDRQIYILPNIGSYLARQAVAFFSSLGLIYVSIFFFSYAYFQPRRVIGTDRIAKITRKIQEWSLFICTICFLFSIFTISLSMFYISRIIYSITIKGGSNQIIIKTFKIAPSHHYFKTIKLPVDHISCQTGRFDPGQYYIVKLKGHWKYFLIDKKGEFSNPHLFDNLIALNRKL